MALLGHNRTIGVIGIPLGKFMSAICSNSPNLANSSGSLVATVVLPLYIGIVDGHHFVQSVTYIHKTFILLF